MSGPPSSSRSSGSTHDGSERECALARWGLVPSWAKEIKFGNRCINARSETLATTAAFRAAYAKRHCLVPLNAFFEWSGEKGHKTKWRIRMKDEPLFAVAGLWEWWRDPSTQQGVETYTIITTEANAVLAPVHDRMPVIVGTADYTRWLDASADVVVAAGALCRRHADDRTGMRWRSPFLYGRPAAAAGVRRDWPDDRDACRASAGLRIGGHHQVRQAAGRCVGPGAAGRGASP